MSQRWFAILWAKGTRGGKPIGRVRVNTKRIFIGERWCKLGARIRYGGSVASVFFSDIFCHQFYISEFFFHDFSENWQKQLLNDQKALAKVYSKVSNTRKETDSWTRHDTFSKGSVIKNDFLVFSIFWYYLFVKNHAKNPFFLSVGKIGYDICDKRLITSRAYKNLHEWAFLTSKVFKV